MFGVAASFILPEKVWRQPLSKAAGILMPTWFIPLWIWWTAASLSYILQTVRANVQCAPNRVDRCNTHHPGIILRTRYAILLRRGPSVRMPRQFGAVCGCFVLAEAGLLCLVLSLAGRWGGGEIQDFGAEKGLGGECHLHLCYFCHLPWIVRLGRDAQAVVDGTVRIIHGINYYGSLSSCLCSRESQALAPRHPVQEPRSQPLSTHSTCIFDASQSGCSFSRHHGPG